MLADGEYVEYNEYNENYMVMMANIEDLPLITRCVASYSLSSTHAAETSLIQGVFLVFLEILAFLNHKKRQTPHNHRPAVVSVILALTRAIFAP